MKNAEYIELNGFKFALQNEGIDEGHPYGQLYSHEEAKTLENDTWQLPTEECFDMLSICPSVWVNQNGIGGRLFDRKLFLPAVGYRNYIFDHNCHYSTNGYYWSISTNTDNNRLANNLLFNSGNVLCYWNDYALNYSVRMILK